MSDGAAFPTTGQPELSIGNCNCLALRRPNTGLPLGRQAAGGFLRAPCVWDGCPASRGQQMPPFFPARGRVVSGEGSELGL